MPVENRIQNSLLLSDCDGAARLREPGCGLTGGTGAVCCIAGCCVTGCCITGCRATGCCGLAVCCSSDLLSKLSCVPHAGQNFDFSGNCFPQFVQNTIEPPVIRRQWLIAKPDSLCRSPPSKVFCEVLRARGKNSSKRIGITTDLYAQPGSHQNIIQGPVAGN